MVSRRAKYAAVAVAALLVAVVLGFVLGLLGTPTVEGVENRFAGVNETTTTIESDVTLDNPNPVDVTLGGVDLDYEIAMNGVPMAAGARDDVSAEPGQSTVPLETYLQNGNIPEWWVTHIDRSETTTVAVDVNLSHGALGGRSATVEQEETIETDLLAGFNSTEPRPVDANVPFVRDPVLYLNETEGAFGGNVTSEATPINMSFTLYNPKEWPFVVTTVGYEVSMNGVDVGAGETDSSTVIAPGGTETIRARTVIRNQRLDEWWVTHIDRNEVTDLEIDFYVIVDPSEAGISGVEPIRLDTDRFNHETQIETDIFGTKPDTAPESGDGDGETGNDAEGGTGDESGDDGTADGSSDDSMVDGSEDGSLDDGGEYDGSEGDNTLDDSEGDGGG